MTTTQPQSGTKTLPSGSSRWMKLLLPGCLLGVPLVFGMWLGHKGNEETVTFFLELNAALEQELDRQREDVLATRSEAASQLQGMSIRLAEMQARLVRMEALGQRLTSMADLDTGEFDFENPPAVGGIEIPVSGSIRGGAVLSQLDQLDQQLLDRQWQFGLLNDLLLDRFLRESSVPSAFPVRSGWVSSGYGARTDPFNGTTAWHNGIDIAGRLGTEVLSVAAGVVSNIEDQEGLGHLVEVTHDGGFLTRYGHNQEVLVAVGDLVEKGEPIALMGSSGRSTGPHVHLEVFKNGRSVDPASYIQRYTR